MIKIFDKNMIEKEYNIQNYQSEIFPLDNFSAFGLEMDGLYFQTSEHAFQYLKFKDTNEDIANKIRNSFSPNEARLIAQVNRIYKPDNWAEIKYENMEKVLRLKVSQNEIVLNKLLSTNDNIIAECCIDEDTEWGIDNNNLGYNHLGKIWMKIRSDFLNNK